MFDDSQLKLFRKQRKELLSNARAQSLGVAVGGVFAPILFLAAQIGTQFGPLNCQERSKDVANDRMNPAETGEDGRAHEMRKERFRLYVRGESHVDDVV